MNKKELEQLQHFVQLMDECYADIEKAKAGKNAGQLEEAETDLAETEAAMLQYMYGILVEAGMIPKEQENKDSDELPY